jgi:membrane fusion protein, multidrug efflux system
MFKHRDRGALRAIEGTDTTHPTATSAAAANVPRLVREAPASNEAGADGVVARKSDSAEQPVEMPSVSAPAATSAAAPQGKRRSGRKTILGLGAILVLALGSWYGHHWWTVGRFVVSTDDAYVAAHTATLAAKIPGYLASVDVNDNAEVKAGDVIARIDDGDYTLAVETARDNVAIEQATVERIGKQTAAQQSAVAQANAQLSSAKAGATRAELELARQQSLAGHEFASRQALEQAQANRDQSVAAVQGAEAGVTVAEANVAVLKAQQEEAQRTLKQFQTAQAKAERDLSFTVIRAPFEGVVGNRAVQSGDYVQPGQRLASLVPLHEVYIDANFKETQLAGMRPGEAATISVDALPDHDIKGRVVSVAPASGSVFSLLPPDNATGNFTKVVQRLAVRIEVPATLKTQELLRPGMSVVVSVNTKTAAETAPAQVAGGAN